MSDKDKSGTLSKAEVEELCEICLSKFIPNKKGEDSMVIQLIEYFTRLLFSCLDVDINTEEIPLQKLRDAIINVRKITPRERQTISKMLVLIYFVIVFSGPSREWSSLFLLRNQLINNNNILQKDNLTKSPFSIYIILFSGKTMYYVPLIKAFTMFSIQTYSIHLSTHLHTWYITK